ncbi:MAG: tetratricopeptide repeat protein [Pirellulales bacterium]
MMRSSFPARVASGLLALAGIVVFCPSLSAQENPTAAGPAEAATRQYAVAAAAQNRGVYEIAVQEWSDFLTKFPGDPRADRAQHYLGICYLKAKKYPEAQAAFEKVLATYPKFAMLEATYLHLGMTQYGMAQEGKADLFDAAAATFGTLLEKYPQGKYASQAVFYRGESFYARGKKDQAVVDYQQLLKSYPGDAMAPQAMYALGVAQEELGQAGEAGKTYDAFLEKYPQNPLAAEITVRRGETLFAAKQYADAAKRFASAAAVPGFALADHATMRQAASLHALGQFAEAAARYASVPAKFPQSRQVAAANLAAGNCYYLAGNYAEARTALGKAQAAGGAEAAEAVHWIARSFLKEKQPAQALKTLAEAISTSASGPYSVQLAMDQADATYEIPERRGESVALYAALAAKQPRDPLAPQALYMATFAAFGMGDHAAAKTHAAAFLKAYGGHELAADVTFVSAEADMQTGRFTEAEAAYGQLVEKYPSHADAETWMVRRGLAWSMQKKHAEAIAALEAIAAKLKNADAKAEAQFIVGSSYVELKQFDSAAKSLAASLAAQPKGRQADEALLTLAFAQRQLNQRDAARAALGKLVAEFPQSKILDRAHYRLGEYAYEAGDLKTAAAEYQEVVRKWPQSPLVPHAVYGLGWAQLSQKDLDAANKTLAELVEKYPQSEPAKRARYARGLVRQQLKDYAGAIADLEAFLATKPAAAEAADARYVLGLCQSASQKPTDAVETFRALLAADPKYAGADKVCYELAWALKSQGKEDEANQTFNRLANDYAESPFAAESSYHVGESQFKNKEFKKAAVSYYTAMAKADKAQDKSDLREKAAHKLGWSYYRLDDFANAERTFAFQRTTFPQGQLAADATFMQAECLFKQGKHQESLALYAAVKNPTTKDFQALSLYHAAQAAGQLKQWDKNLELAKQCATDFPESTYLPEVLYEQAWASQNLDKPDEALPLYESVTAKTDREVAARARYMIGEIHFAKKDYKEAVRNFFKVAYGYGFPTWQADATFEAARCFELLGDKEQARKLHQEVLKLYPQSDKVPLAKKRLEALGA